jgi:hypothetical protein
MNSFLIIVLVSLFIISALVLYFVFFRFDKDGFNSIGYDIKGFNRTGINRAGYNKAGFNDKGINKEGLPWWFAGMKNKKLYSLASFQELYKEDAEFIQTEANILNNLLNNSIKTNKAVRKKNGVVVNTNE